MNGSSRVGTPEHNISYHSEQHALAEKPPKEKAWESLEGRNMELAAGFLPMYQYCSQHNIFCAL